MQWAPHSIRNSIGWKSRRDEKERKANMRQKEREKGREGEAASLQSLEDPQAMAHASTLVKERKTSSQTPVGGSSNNLITLI